jgi:hypothetical protein
MGDPGLGGPTFPLRCVKGELNEARDATAKRRVSAAHAVTELITVIELRKKACEMSVIPWSCIPLKLNVSRRGRRAIRRWHTTR